MLKNIVRLEFMVADKVYHFICDPDSPIEHIKEALFQCQKYVGQLEDNIKAQQAAAVPQPSEKVVEMNKEPQEEIPNDQQPS